MDFEKLPQIARPEKITIKDVDGDARVPYERIKAYDDKEFELFIREWVTSLDGRFEVRGFGGAGDKGRDVIARDDSGNIYYYQCKHYDHPLSPSDIMIELGKLVYYTFVIEIAVPKEYYILAPHDIGPKLNDLILKPTSINSNLIGEWDSKCKNHIKSTATELSLELKAYIEKFDFSIIKTKTMMEVVEEHKKTAFYAFRFGGGLTVHRDNRITIPEALNNFETVYITKFLEAVSEKEGVQISTVEQLKNDFPDYIRVLKVQRERFYSAENLKFFASKNLLSEEYYQDLCNDIFYGIYEFFIEEYDNGFDRMIAALKHTGLIDLSHNLLAKYDLVRIQDRQGVCHQLANDREDVAWVKKT